MDQGKESLPACEEPPPHPTKKGKKKQKTKPSSQKRATLTLLENSMKMSPVTVLEHTAISDHRPQRNWPWAQSPHGGNSLGYAAVVQLVTHPSLAGCCGVETVRHGRPLLRAPGISRACLGKHLQSLWKASNSGQKLLEPVSFSGMFVSDSAETGPKEESRREHEDTHRGGIGISVGDSEPFRSSWRGID